MPSRDSAAEYIFTGMFTSPKDIDPVQIARIFLIPSLAYRNGNVAAVVLPISKNELVGELICRDFYTNVLGHVPLFVPDRPVYPEVSGRG